MNTGQATVSILDQMMDAVATLVTKPEVRRTTAYVSPKYTVKATRQGRPDRRSRQETILVTFDRPNFAERKFIALCKRANVPFPVKKVQIQFWPKPKKK